MKDVTAKYRENKEFLAFKDDLAYLLPTLLELDEEHQMRTDEYPFAFGTITKPQDYFAQELVEDSLSVGLLTDQPNKVKELLRNPRIQKVFVNDKTFLMDIAAPHEGFQTEFLYQSKATNYDGINNILH
ncbi:MAG: hypothetical protein ACTSSG_13270 [Candidatus Heimdallarchaeaceae archaeon]